MFNPSVNLLNDILEQIKQGIDSNIDYIEYKGEASDFIQGAEQAKALAISIIQLKINELQQADEAEWKERNESRRQTNGVAILTERTKHRRMTIIRMSQEKREAMLSELGFYWNTVINSWCEYPKK